MESRETDNTRLEQQSTTFQELVNFLSELGLFKDTDGDNPLSMEDARAFLDGLTPEQREELTRLQEADSLSL